MDSFTDRYYKNIKNLLSIISLWPNDKRWSKQLLRIFICLLLASGTVFQLTSCVTLQCTGDVLLKILLYTAGSLIFFLKYASICFKIGTIAHTFDQLEHNWRNLKDEEEINILKKYSKLGAFLTLGFKTFLWAPVIFFFCYPFASDFLDIILPLNESRPHQLPAAFEYFVDQEKYFYFILINVYAMIGVGTLAVETNESLTILIMAHICGLFKIASYRLTCINNQQFQSQSADPGKQYTTHERIIDALEAHKRALQFGDYFVKNYVPAYLCLLSLGVVILTLSLYRLQQMLLLMDDIPELIVTLFYLCASLTYLLFTNYLGQLIMDHSSSVFIDTYSAPWYKISLSAQHLLLIVMQRSLKAWAISVCGLYVPCFEGFAMIVRMAMSYFMALCSLQ